MGDVNRVQVVVMDSCNGKDNSNGRHPDSWCKDFDVIKARSLVVAFHNKSALVALYRVIYIALDLEYPFGAYHLLASRSRDEFPSAIGAVSIKLFKHSLFPLFYYNHARRCVKSP